MGIIELEHVKKTYEVSKRSSNLFKYLLFREYTEIEAVKDLSLSIEPGEAVGLIGPNGAGKSTLIKMMVGILQPTSGTVLVNGMVPNKKRKENAKHIGAVFGQRTQLWWDLPVEDTLKLHKEIYQIPSSVYESNLTMFQEILDLKSFWEQPVRQLSLGQRMKADLAAALLHNPPILFLDEPTIGLDVVAKKQIRDFLKEINRRNQVTILLTTHDLKDVEEICPRVMMINKGEIVVDTSLENIKSRITKRQISVDFGQIPKKLEKVEGCELIKKEDYTYIFWLDSHQCSFSRFLEAIGKSAPIENVTVQSVDIDEVVRKLYVGEKI